MVKAKFTCYVNEQSEYPDQRSVSFTAAMAFDNEGNLIEENASWSKSTPSGNIYMNITNPDAFNQFEPGAQYYVTFEKINQ